MPYDRDPETFFRRYEQASFRAVHEAWIDLLPAPGSALDVGAGSGRDAAALAQLGWQVLAVEPASGLRRLGETHHPSANIRWVDDHLPALAVVRALEQRFHLILLSAVWMHVPAEESNLGFGAIAPLLLPGGLLVVAAKATGAGPGQRDVPRGEIEALGRAHRLEPIRCRAGAADQEGRTGVTWTTTVLVRP